MPNENKLLKFGTFLKILRNIFWVNLWLYISYKLKAHMYISQFGQVCTKISD